MIRRILSDDPDERMPPPDAKEQLTPEQIDTLRKWITAGAQYDQYWAYAPVAKLPESIDYYVLQNQKSANVKPSPAADRVTLIRRLSFDITGLPPTPAEVAAFVNDKSPNAYEKLVDRLLSSKHYGERMAMFWLDLVRYADTVGYLATRTSVSHHSAITSLTLSTRTFPSTSLLANNSQVTCCPTVRYCRRWRRGTTVWE